MNKSKEYDAQRKDDANSLRSMDKGWEQDTQTIVSVNHYVFHEFR